jgi:hypothetical protein
MGGGEILARLAVVVEDILNNSLLSINDRANWNQRGEGKPGKKMNLQQYVAKSSFFDSRFRLPVMDGGREKREGSTGTRN